MEEERNKVRRENKRRRWEQAGEVYERRWMALLVRESAEGGAELGFDDIPWPVYEAHSPKLSQSIDMLSPEAISAFIGFLSGTTSPDSGGRENSRGEVPDKDKKDRKDKIRETMLRFHPDKFEGRLLGRVKGGDEKEKVREGVGMVVRALNRMMAEGMIT